MNPWGRMGSHRFMQDYRIWEFGDGVGEESDNIQVIELEEPGVLKEGT